MAVRIKATSMLRFARLVTLDGVECWEMPELPVIEPDPTDVVHEVSLTDRMDRISQRYYGSPDFVRIIALANGIDLYPNGLCPGAKLRIPSPARVEDILKLAGAKKEGR